MMNMARKPLQHPVFAILENRRNKNGTIMSRHTFHFAGGAHIACADEPETHLIRWSAEKPIPYRWSLSITVTWAVAICRRSKTASMITRVQPRYW